MKIGGLSKTTLLDYPQHVAATIFTEGCNFRCPFCHNAGLLGGGKADETDTAYEAEEVQQAPYSVEQVLAFLQKRKGILQGVCITGGEPTLQSDLPAFIRSIKQLGYLVKLDTNGYQPEVLRRLLQEGLLDYIAMDVKNSREKYGITVGKRDLDTGMIHESIGLIRTSGINYEFRTTIVAELHTREDLLAIGRWLQGSRAYYLQSYRDNENVLCQGYHAYPDAVIKEWAKLLTGYCDIVETRGIEG